MPPPSNSDPNSIKTKIYFFSTPKFIEIHISKKNNVNDVIKHVLTLYQKDRELAQNQPLQFPTNPEAYELRLIDDDDDYYIPYYDIPPLERTDEFGEFETLAFV